MSCVNVLPKDQIDTGIFVKGEIPTGDIDCSNLDFETSCEFIPSTLEVFIDGVQKQRGVDYSVNVNNKSFTFILQADNGNGLNSPPESTEVVTVNYIKASNSSGCVSVI